MRQNKQGAPKDFYHFDDAAKEVVIHRYDTPTPWMNYLSNGNFHTMMSQAGGALAFYKSPQIWRINRYRFFHLPTDRSGLYYYLQDADTGAYWCPTAEPAVLKPKAWRAVHGLGYTKFFAEHDGLKAELCYFIGSLENCVIWNLKLTNASSVCRRLRVFSFLEFGMMEFLREISWVCYNKHQLSVTFDESIQSLVYNYGVEMQLKPKETPLIYLASDQKLAGFDGDRDEFIGSYASESNPHAIENGGCTNSILRGGDPCGALQVNLTLNPGETRELNTYLGAAENLEKVRAALDHCRQPGFVDKSLRGLNARWNRQLAHFSCMIPDASAQRQINIWNPYQAQRNFLFSRNISYYATGTFRGTGFRDSSQDLLAHIPFSQSEAKAKLRELLAQQYADGHTNHYYFPVEGMEPLKRIHSDNHLWPIIAVWNLVMEDWRTDILLEKIPYYDGGEGTVYEHLKQSVAFVKSHLGSNGFPLMLASDWNDMLYKVGRAGRGESIWVSMMLGYVLPKLEKLAELLGLTDDAREYRRFWEEQKQLVNTKAWDGRWFRRAITDNGEYLGTHHSPECRVWLNAQTWSVLSGMVDDTKMYQAMDSVREILDTDLGIKKLHPPIIKYPDPQDPLSHYHPGCGENGSIFCHANTWAVIAECMLGRADLAWKYYRQLIPAVAQEKAGVWRYRAEPYVYSSNLFGPDSDNFGLANVSWLTGTAAWMYVAATQHILGIRPAWEGLLIDPCLPSAWERVSVTRVFRNVTYEISIEKPKGLGKGEVYLEVGGQPVDGNVVPPPGLGIDRVQVLARIRPATVKSDHLQTVAT